MNQSEDSKDAKTPLLLDFEEAYGRLKKREPRDTQNAELLQKGKLRINKLTLAREAGHSRTNYLNHADVQRFAEQKLGLKERVPREIPSVELANKEYRRRNSELENEVEDLKTQLAEMVCYVDYLEKKFKVNTNKVDWTGSANIVVGRSRRNPTAVKTISSKTNRKS